MGRLARKPCSCQLRGDSKFSLQIDSSESVTWGGSWRCRRLFRDPEHFRAGELREHVDSWKEIVMGSPSLHQSEVLVWIEGKVSVFPYFQHFSGVFKGESYDSDLPPGKAFFNNVSCKPFVKFFSTNTS